MTLPFRRSVVRTVCGALAAAAGLWALPGTGRAQPAAPAGFIEVTDLAQRTVRLPARVDRVLLGEGRLLPAIAVFDREDPTRRLVGMMGEFEKLDAPGYAQWARRFPHLDQVPRVGRTSSGSFSDEQAIALRPQVAILGLAGGHGPSERDRETLARLEAAGVAAVFIDFRHDPLRNTPRSMEPAGRGAGPARRGRCLRQSLEGAGGRGDGPAGAREAGGAHRLPGKPRRPVRGLLRHDGGAGGHAAGRRGRPQHRQGAGARRVRHPEPGAC